jgi:hypothetical protein
LEGAQNRKKPRETLSPQIYADDRGSGKNNLPLINTDDTDMKNLLISVFQCSPVVICFDPRRSAKIRGKFFDQRLSA